MGRQRFTVEESQPRDLEDALDGDQRQIGKVLVIDRVELTLGDQPLQMRKFDR